MRHWPGEWCKRCDRRNVVGFTVSAETWQRVTSGRFGVLCPTCFDELAQEEGVAYRFVETHPVTWSMWDHAPREPEQPGGGAGK